MLGTFPGTGWKSAKKTAKMCAFMEDCNKMANI